MSGGGARGGGGQVRTRPHGETVAVIPARGGSRGVPRKNLRRVGGIPLVARAITSARQSQRIDRVVVSTDDDEIAAVAREWGAEVVMRPESLSGDTASSESALEHALEQLSAQGVPVGVLVFIQATSPFIDPGDLDAAVGRVGDGESDCVFSAVESWGFLWRGGGVPAVEFLEELNVVAHKVASASVTDLELLSALAATGKPIILSTGMSTMEQIDAAVRTLGTDDLILMHATSTYPLPPEEANIRMVQTLKAAYPEVPVGYSGHERGLQISLAAVALGATAAERHITLDRAMWGSDHAASLEPTGLEHLVRDIRVIEQAMGTGVKQVFPGELAPMAKLRRVSA